MTAITFTRNISSVSGRTIMPIFLLNTTPALLTSTSIRPSRLNIDIKADLTAAASVTSKYNGITRVSCTAAHCFTHTSMLPSCRSQAYTIAPSPAKRSAIDFPMPCAAPVMIHTLFSKNLPISTQCHSSIQFKGYACHPSRCIRQ